MSARAEPRFDLDLRYGEAGEQLIGEYFDWIATGNARVEVKRKTYEDGYFFVETFCDKGRNGDFTRSGINVTEAEAWAFLVSNTGIALIVPTAHIKSAFAHNLGEQRVNDRGNCPTKGRLFHVSDFMKAAKP